MPADEFDIIRTLFAPIANSAGARGLIDDVSVLDVSGKLVVTTDAIVEGVHFLSADPLHSVAKKALRVNFSDLIAKGAKPIAVTLALMWPNHRPASEIADFARGLGEDLKLYDVALLGGDTTATPGPLAISVTAFGVPLGARTPSRADASVGEQLWVTGCIGDGFLGLASLSAAPLARVDARAEAVQTAYRTPAPPRQFAPAIAAHASASMDVSDGLIADAEKMAAASGVALRIYAGAVPLSAAGQAYVEAGGEGALLALLTGGDDYQALFTAPADARGAIEAAGRATETNVTLIGDALAGAGVRLVKMGDIDLPLGAGGHRHELGR
jgi:thiamine-monophosphate kinase